MPVADDIKTGLPAEFVAAITQVTGVGEVYVNREQRVETGAIAVWVRPPTEFIPDGGGLSEPQIRREYQVRIEKFNGTDVDLEEFQREAFRYFHGKQKPVVVGLRFMLVEDMILDINPEEGGNVAVLFTLVAVTREPISTG